MNLDKNKITFKKYPNRRLYDTEKSTYVTLRDIAEIIKAGRQIEVIDLRTNEDITAFILTQIIVEQVKKNNSLLPVSLLHLIIRFGEDTLSEFFESYLERIVQSYLKYKKTMDDQFEIYFEMGIDFSKIAKKTIKDLSAFPSFFDGSSTHADKNKDHPSE